MKQIKNNSPFISPKKKVFISSYNNHHISLANKNNLFIFQLINENLKFPLNENERILNKHLFKSKYNKIPSIKTLIQTVKQKFQNKYSYNLNFYNIKKINEILCSNNTHIVAKYKDYLIYSDYIEFLQKTYLLKESLEFLPQILKYYHSYYVIFPNYINLPQSKIIYKNILKKQKIIDQYQGLEEKKEKIKKGIIRDNIDINPIFTTQVFDSILNQTDTSGIQNFFGLQNKELSKNLSIENLINKITSAENFNKTKIQNTKIKCALKKIKGIKSELEDNYKINNLNEIKGRNYNRYINGGINITKCNNYKKKINNSGLNINNTISNGMKNTKVSSTTLDMDSKNNNFSNQNNNNCITTYNSSNHRNNRSNIINSINSSNHRNNRSNIINSIYYLQKKNLTNNFSNNVKSKKVIKFNENDTKKYKKIRKLFSENYFTSEYSSSKPKEGIIKSRRHKKKLSLISSTFINNKIFSDNDKTFQNQNKSPNQIHKRFLSYNTSHKEKMKNIILSNNNMKKKFIPLTERNFITKSEISSNLINMLTCNLNNCNFSQNSTTSNSINKNDYNYQKSGVLTSLINNTIRNEIKEIYKKKINKNKTNSNIDNIFPCNNNKKTLKKIIYDNTKNRSISPKISIYNKKISSAFIDDEMIKNNYNIENENNIYNKKFNKNKKKGFKGILYNIHSISRNIVNNERKNVKEDLTNKNIRTKRNNSSNYINNIL